MIKRTLIRGGLLIVAAFVILGIVLTRDGTLTTPEGSGTVTTVAGEFEGFALPDYAADALNSDFESYLVEVGGGLKMHVLEIGQGQPVYLQHGLPTSGLLYRQLADILPQEDFRLILPTLIGLGFSSKIPASQHVLDDHIEWTNAMLNRLDLQDVIYVGHDWGGPIGAGALARSPELMGGMVVLNTVLDAPRAPREAPAVLRLVQAPVLGELILEGITSFFAFLPGSQNDPDTMSPDVVALYSRPLDDSGNRKAPLAFARMSVLSPENPDAQILRVTENYLINHPVPTEIVWGMNDPVLGGRLADMQALLPWATVTETEAGHFLQEEVPGEIAAAIQRVRQQMKSED